MKQRYLRFILLLATLAVIESSLVVTVCKASLPTISVSPSTTAIEVGEQFTINITLSYASSLYGYETWLSFDNNKLNATAINYLNYLNDPHMIWHQEVNNPGGYVSLAVSSQFPATGKTGGSPPPLATVHFKCIGAGTSPLYLYKTILSDDQAVPITHQTADGQVICMGGEPDLAILNVTPSPPGKNVVGQGFDLKVTVTVLNQGGFPETFNVTTYVNNTAIQRQSVTNLPPGNSTALAFVWDTTGFSYGNYAIKAVADTVPGETNTEDNTYIDGVVKVVIPGDINGDGTVNILDAIKLAGAFGSRPGDSKWNPNADINGDGVVNILDAINLAGHFGEIV